MSNAEILEWLCGYTTPGEGGCMIWRGAVSSGQSHRLPTVRDPVSGRNMPARRVLMAAMGKNINGLICTTSCRDPMCMAPGHAQAVTRRQLQQRSAEKLRGNIVRAAKLAEAARRQSPLTMEDVRLMRASGMRATDAAKRWGVHLRTASKILRGQAWRDYGRDPFSGLGARA